MRLYGAGALAPPCFVVRHFSPSLVRTRRRTRAGVALFARRAMASSKAEDSWTEPEGVLCRLYKSGLVKFGINLGWPKDMERTTKRTLAKSAVEAVRTHKDFALLAAYAASVASAQPMDVAQSSNAGVGQRELRGLQGAERRVHRSRSSARACSQTTSCTRRAQFVTITSRGTLARGTAQCAM